MDKSEDGQPPHPQENPSVLREAGNFCTKANLNPEQKNEAKAKGENKDIKNMADRKEVAPWANSTQPLNRNRNKTKMQWASEEIK